ncbi:MAG: AbrB/MazE/SpoVT family DNA-binding domain-containing protein [candidate division Zixibacteria bacterium]|nr:AbrB/MazE/SpoVT family DNA-binding domain-containing protein [candidate division Zixibacteria bacterium]
MRKLSPKHRFQPDEIKKIKKVWPDGKTVSELEKFFGKSYEWVRRFAARHRLPVEKKYPSGDAWAIRSLLQFGYRGQGVSLPRNFCRQLNLNPGDKLLLERKGKSILVRKLKRKKLDR